MSSFIIIPFHAFKLKFHGGNQLVLPLRDLNALRLGTSLALLAGKYAEKFQKTFVDQSDYLALVRDCLLYTSPSPRDLSTSRMPSSA